MLIPELGTTAVLALLPDAEELLTSVRHIRSQLVRPLPAHVSLLYPGPSPATDVDEINRIADPLPSEVYLSRVVSDGDGFVGLGVPELDVVTSRLREHFPALVPYDGRYGAAPEPHLTLALGATGTEVEQVRASIATRLPFRSRVEGAYFVERTADGWVPVTAAR